VRGKISDQDLTDYALNELEPAERLYLESMLAVSEECREDIYKTIDLAQMLEEGFERDAYIAAAREQEEELALRPEQRERLVQPHFTKRYVVRDLISALGLAACITFVATKLEGIDFSGAQNVAGRVAQASTKAAGAVTTAVQTQDPIDFAKSLETLRSLAEEGARLVPTTDPLPEPPTICTPPTLIMESAQLTNFGDMTQ
jgi:anti-sigma factor RsiW